MPAVSVVMPVRDALATLEAAIRSIRQQTLPDWELIVVDDGSCDGSAALLDQLAACDGRIHVHHTAPRGIACALRLGCERTRGQWIARMDADDLMHPERLEKQWQHAAAHPELGVISCRVAYGGDGPGYRAHVDWVNSLITPDEIALRRFVEAPVAHPSVMFRRELPAIHGGYRDGDFPEDYELWLRWLDAGVRFGKVDEELLVWNDSPGRLSRSDPRYAVEHFYACKCQWLARWLRREVAPGRELWLWGAGRVTRRRFALLEREGLVFTGFIDVDPRKVGGQRDGRPVRLHEDLPDRDRAFIVVGVAKRGVRDEIRKLLDAAGWVEGRDYLLAA